MFYGMGFSPAMGLCGGPLDAIVGAVNRAPRRKPRVAAKRRRPPRNASP